MASRKPKTPPTPTGRAEKKRIEILKAATRCFRKAGFHQTSMQEICAEIGLGPGAVYRYFSSKEALIEAMAEDERKQARSILLDLRQADHLPDALAGVALAFAERYGTVSDVGLMTEVYAEGLRNKRVGNVIRKTESEWIDGLTDLLRTAQMRGQIDPTLDPRSTALLLTAMWDGMIIRQAYSVDDAPQAMLAFFDLMLKRLLLREGKPEKRIRATPAQPPVQAAVLTTKKDEAESAVELDPRQMSLI